MGDRLFSKKHLWVLQEGEMARIGLTDFLQEKLGAIMFVNLPGAGEALTVGEVFGDVESKKTVMELEAPLSGEVVSVNETVEDEPDMINEHPHDAWLVEVKVSSMPDDLMDEDTYHRRIEQPWMQKHEAGIEDSE